MSAGFFARYRSHLFSHPSFWASEDRPLEIIESTSLVNAEKRVYVLLQSLSLPLVLNIEDCAVNVAALLGEDRTDQTQHLYRLQSMKGHLVTGKVSFLDLSNLGVKYMRTLTYILLL